MPESVQTLAATWMAPANVRALTTLRAGGVSRGSYASFNLGDHVGDDPQAVGHNRSLLCEMLPAEPSWLKQVHGTRVVNAWENVVGTEADGAWTDRPHVVCAVLTADCLPVFLCDRQGTRVALVHAGWRGLAHGVIEAGVKALAMPGRELLAYLGPAIGPDAYEVGNDVRTEFVRHDAQATEGFRPNGHNRWFADMYVLARQRLLAAGITDISGGGFCTLREQDRFYSYRRDGVTGRMASLIWLS